jgi:hypothetical protein
VYNIRLKHTYFTTDLGNSNEKLVWSHQHRGTPKEHRPTFNACLGEAVNLALGETRGATVWGNWHDMQNANGHS